MPQVKLSLSDEELEVLESKARKMGFGSVQSLLRALAEDAITPGSISDTTATEPAKPAAPTERPVEPGKAISAVPPAVHMSATRSLSAKRPEDWVYPEQIELWRRLLLPVGNLIGQAYPMPYTNWWPINPVFKPEVHRLFVEQGWESVGFAVEWSYPISVNRRPAVNRRGQPFFAGDIAPKAVFSGTAENADTAIELLEQHDPLMPMDYNFDTAASVGEIYTKLYKLYALKFAAAYVQSCKDVRSILSS